MAITAPFSRCVPQLAGQCGAVLDEHIASSSSCDRFCARLELPIYENAGDSAASFSKGFTATSQLTNSASVMVRSSPVVAHLLCFRFRARLWPTTIGSGSRARIPGGLTSGTCASNTAHWSMPDQWTSRWLGVRDGDGLYYVTALSFHISSVPTVTAAGRIYRSAWLRRQRVRASATSFKSCSCRRPLLAVRGF